MTLQELEDALLLYYRHNKECQCKDCLKNKAKINEIELAMLHRTARLEAQLCQ